MWLQITKRLKPSDLHLQRYGFDVNFPTEHFMVIPDQYSVTALNSL